MPIVQENILYSSNWWVLCKRWIIYCQMIITLVNPTTNRQQIEMESNQEFVSCWARKRLQPNKLSCSSKATIALAMKGMSTPIWAAWFHYQKIICHRPRGRDLTLSWTLSLNKPTRADYNYIGQTQHPLHNTGVQLPQYFWPQCPQDWTGIGEKVLETRPTKQNKNYPGQKVWMFHGICVILF